MNKDEAIEHLNELKNEMQDIGFGDMMSVLNTQQIQAIDTVLQVLEKQEDRIKELEKALMDLDWRCRKE